MHRPSRALAALAASTLATPVLVAAAPAFAAPPDPGSPRSTAEFCAPVPASYDPFTDDEPNTFTREIECVAYAGITQGGPRGIGQDKYGPGFEVPRDQMASFIARTIDAADFLDTGDEVQELPAYDGSNAFSDVAAGNPHLQTINRLEAVGITVGAPAGKQPGQYGPELLVTRAQMATFINRAIAFMAGQDPARAGNGTGLTTALDYFTDDENVAPHEPNINGLASEGINVGDGQDTVRPFNPIKRDQMAGFLARTLAYLEAVGDIAPVAEDAATKEPDGGPGPAPAENIAVTPDGELAPRVAVPNPDTVATDDQTYSVTGLVAGQEYRITLVVEANVTRNSAGEEVFVEDGTTGLAATGNRTADITQVDGQPAQNNTGDGTTRTATDSTNGGTAVFVADADGTSTFVVDGDQAPESVLPVVYRNGGAANTEGDGGRSPRLELNDDGTAAEAYDVGAVVEFEDTTVATVTVRPELQSTAIVRTFTNPGPTPATADDRQQTEVRFTFDEPVTGKTPTADRFHLVGFDSSERFDGTSAVVQSDGRSVLVTFGAAPTATDPQGESDASDELRDVSLATVDFDAVRDRSQAENPIGDDAIGASRTDASGAAGKTDAPDLVSVGGVASPSGQSSTTVVFTFDEPAFTVVPAGFHLVITPTNQDITCTAVDGAAGGQPGADQEATTTIRVSCPEADFGGDITEADIARGYVDAGTVSDSRQSSLTPGTEGVSNPLQASQTPDRDTTAPDLVKATFEPADGTRDVVVYTFDEPVLVLDDTDTDGTTGADTDSDGATGAGDFRIYPVTGGPGTAATSVERSTVNGNEIVATFADRATANAVGANVEERAVIGDTGFARPNQEDEVGVENLSQQTFTAGRTDGPDLVGVALGSDGTATYTFDEDVLTDVTGTATNVDEGRLFLVLGDGTQLRCTASRVETATRTDADTVTCTAYTVEIPGGGAATADQVRRAVLGTVDDGAVRDTAATPNPNPEGAELTTGGTGTPAA